MLDFINLKPQDIDTVEKRGKLTVGVVGCGEKGVEYGIAFAEAGFRVICTDANQNVVRCLAKGKTPLPNREIEPKLKSLTRRGLLSATSDLKDAVARSDIVLLTVPPRIGVDKNVDYAEAESSYKEVGTALRQGILVIYCGPAGFGFMERIVKETLENTSGLKASENFGLAYNPPTASDLIRQKELLSDRELRVAANDKNSLEAASAVLATITRKGIKQISEFGIAELASLFEFARRDANVALNNEFAMLCEKAGKDFFETVKAEGAECRESSDAPTVAEEYWRDESYLLLEGAENLNAKLRLTALARQINEDMVKHAASLVQDTMRSCGKTLRRARIAVLGAPRPRTSNDEFIKILDTKGAKISIYDALSSQNDSGDSTRSPRRALSETIEGSDCIVILTGEEQFKRLNLKNLRTLMRTPAAIVDLVGIVEPQKAEKEGFIYRGLGRVSEKK